MISDERLDLMNKLAERRIEAGRMDMVMNSEEVASLCSELLAHRKAESATPNGWIKCKDRLPPGEEFVLAYWSQTGHVEDVFFAFDEDEPDQRYHVLYDGERMLQEPTHWMPLSRPQDN